MGRYKTFSLIVLALGACWSTVGCEQSSAMQRDPSKRSDPQKHSSYSDYVRHKIASAYSYTDPKAAVTLYVENEDKTIACGFAKILGRDYPFSVRQIDGRPFPPGDARLLDSFPGKHAAAQGSTARGLERIIQELCLSYGIDLQRIREER